MAIEDIELQCEEGMEKSIDALKKELAAIRTGHASPSLLDQIKVDVYGQQMALPTVASVATSDARTLTVSVWDAGNVKAVDSAIRQSNLNLNPRLDGNKLFITLPELTAERRQEMIKLVKQKGEDFKVRVRNVRRDGNDGLKKLEKDKEISEDELKASLEDIQKLTDKTISTIDNLLDTKQKDLETI